MRNLRRLIFVGAAGAVFLTGCTPTGPMPPMFGPGGTGILLFIIVAAVGYFIWHKLTDISARLESLEKDVRSLKNKSKGEDHE